MDSLKLPVPKFYTGQNLYSSKGMKEKRDAMDEAGRILLLEACRRKQIQDALAASYHRRTHSKAYITRDKEKRLMYLDDFDQLGARWVKEASEINNRLAEGYYTEAEYTSGETMNGVVLCFTRHGLSDEHGSYGGNVPDKAKGRIIYMAGTYHSDWDGVTLDLDTTDDADTAARWADSMAEHEAEDCREEDARYRREQQIEELKDQIGKARAACLELLRDMRPIRKGLSAFPESVCQALRDQVQAYCETIADWRRELKEV